MDANEYQKKAMVTAVYPRTDKMTTIQYTALGLAGEAGEVANQVKKAIRDDEGAMYHHRREALIAELGDVLWYCAALATELQISLSAVMDANLHKLAKRAEKDAIKGEGDKR